MSASAARSSRPTVSQGSGPAPHVFPLLVHFSRRCGAGHHEVHRPSECSTVHAFDAFVDSAIRYTRLGRFIALYGNTRCSNSSVARLSTAPCSAGTSSDWEPSAFETRAESIGMCRKRSFATGGRWHLPARAAVCRIPCLILWLADVERVCQCHTSAVRRTRPGQIPIGLTSYFIPSTGL